MLLLGCAVLCVLCVLPWFKLFVICSKKKRQDPGALPFMRVRELRCLTVDHLAAGARILYVRFVGIATSARILRA